MKASEAGLNPYTRNVGDVNADPIRPMPRIDPRASGLEGDILDQLLKGRWQEGYDVGRPEGRRDAAALYADVFDNGFEEGHNNGRMVAGAQLAAQVAGLLGRVQATLQGIVGKTGSEDVKAIAFDGIGTINEIIEAISGVPQQEGQPQQEGPS